MLNVITKCSGVKMDVRKLKYTTDNYTITVYKSEPPEGCSSDQTWVYIQKQYSDGHIGNKSLGFPASYLGELIKILEILK